jgi:hypothetical protein
MSGVRHAALSLVLALGLVGCGDRTTATGGDLDGGNGGSDAPVVRSDAGPPIIGTDDAGHPIIGIDDGGNPIYPPDGPVAQPDAPVVIGDAGGPGDAASAADSGSTPGTIPCGQGQSCAVGTEQCCIGQGGTTASCIPVADQCQGFAATCDGPEDCSADTPICCATLGGGDRGAACVADGDCGGMNSRQLCRVDGDCQSGESCCGGGELQGIAVTWCEPTDQCPNTNPTPGVPCGTETCTAPDVCCMTWSSQSCTAVDACTQGVALACDGPEDCAGATPVCCGDLGMGGGASECVAQDGCAGSGMGGGVVCHTDADCPTGTCQTLPFVDLSVCR